MANAIRLNEDLIHDAEIESLISKRSTPKQIEFWAQIGKAVAHNASRGDLLALMQGLSQVQITPLASAPVNPVDIFTAVDNAREDGSLRQSISKARLRYQASQTQPGLLDRIHPDGHRETGRFHNGQFTISN